MEAKERVDEEAKDQQQRQHIQEFTAKFNTGNVNELMQYVRFRYIREYTKDEPERFNWDKTKEIQDIEVWFQSAIWRKARDIFQTSVHFHISDDHLQTDKLNLHVTNMLTAFGMALRQWVFPRSKMHSTTGTHLATVACGHPDKDERCKKLIKVSFVPVGAIRVYKNDTIRLSDQEVDLIKIFKEFND